MSGFIVYDVGVPLCVRRGRSRTCRRWRVGGAVSGGGAGRSARILCLADNFQDYSVLEQEDVQTEDGGIVEGVQGIEDEESVGETERGRIGTNDLDAESQGKLQKLRQIGIAGSETVQRLAEDLRVSMAPATELVDTITLRSASSNIALDIALVFGLFLLLRYGVSRALHFLYHKLDPNRGKVSYEESVFECMQRPLEFLSVFTVGTSIAEVVARPLSATSASKYIRVSRELGVIIAATWFILRWIERIRSRFTSVGMDKTQVSSISRLATVFTVAIAILVMMDTIGLRVQSVLAFGGIGGVAIGFAGREILSNFFAGFMLFLTRPFTVGDWIRSIENEKVEGTVEDMGWYMTIIRTWEKRPLYIPNSRFSTFIIENPSRMSNRRIKHEIHIRLEDVSVAEIIATKIRSMLESNNDLDPRQHKLAFVDRFAPHSIVLWVSCYSRTVFLSDYRALQQRVLMQIHEIIHSNGARLASDLYRSIEEGKGADLQRDVRFLGNELEIDQTLNGASMDRPEESLAVPDSAAPQPVSKSDAGERTKRNTAAKQAAGKQKVATSDAEIRSNQAESAVATAAAAIQAQSTQDPPEQTNGTHAPQAGAQTQERTVSATSGEPDAVATTAGSGEMYIRGESQQDPEKTGESDLGSTTTAPGGMYIRGESRQDAEKEQVEAVPASGFPAVGEMRISGQSPPASAVGPDNTETAEVSESKPPAPSREMYIRGESRQDSEQESARTPSMEGEMRISGTNVVPSASGSEKANTSEALESKQAAPTGEMLIVGEVRAKPESSREPADGDNTPPANKATAASASGTKSKPKSEGETREGNEKPVPRASGPDISPPRKAEDREMRISGTNAVPLTSGSEKANTSEALESKQTAPTGEMLIVGEVRAKPESSREPADGDSIPPANKATAASASGTKSKPKSEGETREGNEKLTPRTSSPDISTQRKAEDREKIVPTKSAGSVKEVASAEDKLGDTSMTIDSSPKVMPARGEMLIVGELQTKDSRQSAEGKSQADSVGKQSSSTAKPVAKATSEEANGAKPTEKSISPLKPTERVVSKSTDPPTVEDVGE